MKSQNVIRPTRILATLALLALGAGLATAAPPSPAAGPSRVVRFHDLNLANAKDVATLYRRITRAAHWVCGDDTPPVRNLATLPELRECIDTTIERAITDANRPALTALYRGKITRLAGE